MFEKILAVLPYNPSLINQLSFYGGRLRREQAVRRFGVIFIVLAFFVQFFAFLSPPQSTIANSSNDIINNGISSAANAATHCRNNTQNFGDILKHYGISCDAVGAAGTIDLRSTDHNRTLYSMGRLAYGKAGEQPVNISGKTYYLRFLWSFDSRAYSTYKALAFKNSAGKTFYILYNCGNLVSPGIPTPVAPPAPPAPPAPAPTPKQAEVFIAKGVRFGGSTGTQYYKRVNVKSNDTVEYVIRVVNTGETTLANVRVSDAVPAGIQVNTSSIAVDGAPVSGTLSGLNIGSLSPRQQKRVTYTAVVTKKTSDTVTFGPFKRTPAAQEGCDTLTNTATVTAGQLPPKTDTADVRVCTTVTTVVSDTPVPETPQPQPPTKPCDASVSSTDTLACISVSKAAANTTQNIADAHNTKANTSDTIVYTLYAKNSGKAAVKDYVFQENMSDVLDYAEITDLHGGKLSDENVVSWPAVDIAAGSTAQQKITVKVKAIIPSTPVSSSDAAHFDLIMTNVYGNTVNIELPTTPVKTVESVAATLPQTGPGTSLAAAAAIVIIASYFFARARLLAFETKIAIQENANGGF